MRTVDSGRLRNNKPVILVAEDDPDQSDSLREVFESEGYSVETVFSGDIALQRLTSRSYSAAVMDGRMPGLHGGTVLKACRVRDPHICTPIIMVSAFASPHDLAQYKKDGAAASFTKPLNIVEVLKFVRQLLDTVPKDNCQQIKAETIPGRCES